MKAERTDHMNYDVIDEPGARPVKCWTRGVELEAQAREQLLNVARLPFVHHHVAVMPDVHWGMGATVGSVVPTVGAIIPAAVGVDIGCGMAYVRTGLTASDLPDALASLRDRIERAVPHGRTNQGGPGDRGAWGDIPDDVIEAWSPGGSSGPDSTLAHSLKSILHKHPKIAGHHARGRNQVNHLGTLGTGNHFVEVVHTLKQVLCVKG